MDTTEQQEFSIALTHGEDRVVSGWRGQSVGVHQEEPGVWRITHLASGLLVTGRDLHTDADALDLAALIDPIFPAGGAWREQPEDKLVQRRITFLVRGWFADRGY